MLLERHKDAVEKIKKEFKSLGYTLHFFSLNAKDYGVAQDRKRIFYLGFRKDLKINFQIPEAYQKKSL